MATGSATWNGATDLDWNVDANWTPAQHPIGGDTATFDGNEAAGIPTSNLPAAGEINFVFTGVYSEDLDDFLNGATVGTVLINNAATIIDPRDGATQGFGTATVTAGILNLNSENYAGDVVLNGGKLQGRNIATLDGDITATAASFVDWNESGGVLIVTGSFDADGNTITHTNTTGASIVCDNTAFLDLGSVTDTGIDLEIAANTTTQGADVLVGDFTRTGGTITPAGFTIIASGNVEGVVGAGMPNISMPGTGKTLDWASGAAGRIQKLTIDGTINLTGGGTHLCEEFAGSGTLGRDAAETLTIRQPADNFSTFTGTITVPVLINMSADRSNILLFKCAGVDIKGLVSNHILTLTGGLDAGGGEVYPHANNVGEVMTLIAAITDGGAVVLGDKAAADKSGGWTASGVSDIASLASGNAANTANAFGLGTGTLQLSGVFEADNGANDITCTNTTGYIIGGTVQNAVFDNNVDHLVDAAVDSGNTNVTEIIGGRSRATNTDRDVYPYIYPR